MTLVQAGSMPAAPLAMIGMTTSAAITRVPVIVAGDHRRIAQLMEQYGMRKSLFDVDHEGLRKVLGDRPKGRLLLELVQNCLDEDVTTVTIEVVPDPDARGVAKVRIEDDSPEGFRDVSDSYTLFAPSYKGADPEKVGCYNLGEKLVIAVCRHVVISTTKGTVEFDVARGERTERRVKRGAGTVFEARLKMNGQEREEALAVLRTVLVPEGVTVTVNGIPLPHRLPIHTFTAPLDTRIVNGEGELTRTTRKTEVRIYEVLPVEEATLYERAMPVVANGTPWHIAVGQKVPNNMDRNNVRTKYLHHLRLLVLNEMHAHLSDEQTAAPWVDDAANDERCAPEAVRTIIRGRFGDKVVGSDPSDREAEKTATVHGHVVVPPRAIPPVLRQQAKEAGLLLPAGQVFPTYKPYDWAGGGNGSISTFLDEGKWPDGIRHIAGYARFLAQEVLGIDITVRVVSPEAGIREKMAACWCKRAGHGEELHFNLVRLGHGWFNGGVREEVDELLVHEMAHHYAPDHLSEEFHEALCRIGASMKALALRHPAKFDPWSSGPA